MDNIQSKLQQMLHEDRKRDTFKFLTTLTGLKLNREQIFVIGGGQQFSHRHSPANNLNEQQNSENAIDASLSILDLPDEVYLHLFSFLTPIELCKVSNVCKKWYRLATDDNVWRQRLRKDMKYWPSISSRSNPITYQLVESDRSQKEIYLTCSPNIRRANQTDDSFVYLTQLSNYISQWINGTKHLIMFGPGLESYTSPLVRNLLWDESKRFQTMGMIPGNAGFGSGIKIKLNSYIFNLITLYTNCMKERESRTKTDRLVSNNRLVRTNDADQYDISPQVRDVCREANGLVYVIDADRNNQLVDFCTELQVMTREFSDVPLLILSCVKDSETQRWAAIDVVKDLQLSTLGNPWFVQDCCVDGMNGVDTGFMWLLTPNSQRQNTYFPNNENV